MKKNLKNAARVAVIACMALVNFVLTSCVDETGELFLQAEEVVKNNFFTYNAEVKNEGTASIGSTDQTLTMDEYNVFNPKADITIQLAKDTILVESFDAVVDLFEGEVGSDGDQVANSTNCREDELTDGQIAHIDWEWSTDVSSQPHIKVGKPTFVKRTITPTADANACKVTLDYDVQLTVANAAIAGKTLTLSPSYVIVVESAEPAEPTYQEVVEYIPNLETMEIDEPTVAIDFMVRPTVKKITTRIWSDGRENEVTEEDFKLNGTSNDDQVMLGNGWFYAASVARWAEDQEIALVASSLSSVNGTFPTVASESFTKKTASNGFEVVRYERPQHYVVNNGNTKLTDGSGQHIYKTTIVWTDEAEGADYTYAWTIESKLVAANYTSQDGITKTYGDTYQGQQNGTHSGAKYVGTFHASMKHTLTINGESEELGKLDKPFLIFAN